METSRFPLKNQTEQKKMNAPSAAQQYAAMMKATAIEQVEEALA